MTTAWFGKSWGAPVNRECPQISTPVGKKCLWCEEEIKEGDSGLTYPSINEKMEVTDAHSHVECNARSIFGSVGHQLHRCSCYGGTWEDPPGMSKRGAALVAEGLAVVMEKFRRLYDEPKQ